MKHDLPLRVEGADVARMKPAVGVNHFGSFFRGVIVSGQHIRPAGNDFTLLITAANMARFDVHNPDFPFIKRYAQPPAAGFPRVCRPACANCAGAFG